jgi:DNA-binding response OmpR family regulator
MKKPIVLIVDDDPSHLRIYGWIIQAAGFDPLSALVTHTDVELPDGAAVDLVLLDYHLNGSTTDPARLVELVTQMLSKNGGRGSR